MPKDFVDNPTNPRVRSKCYMGGHWLYNAGVHVLHVVHSRDFGRYESYYAALPWPCNAALLRLCDVALRQPFDAAPRMSSAQPEPEEPWLLREPDSPWVMRTYAGHSTAEASNELYRGNLAK